jgi:hypothetical protein
MISPLRRKRGTRRGIKKRGSWWGAKERQKSPLKTQAVSKTRARYLEEVERLDSGTPFQSNTEENIRLSSLSWDKKEQQKENVILVRKQFTLDSRQSFKIENNVVM